MDKQTAERLACLIAAELVSDDESIQTIIQRERLVDTDEDERLLTNALERLYFELLERSDTDDEDEDDPVLRERYESAEAKLAQEDHTELLRRLRGPGLFDEGSLDE